MLPSFAKLNTSDRVISQLQDNLGKAIDNLNALQFNGGILQTGIDLVLGDNTLYTQLPQACTGYIIVLKDANVDIYDKQSTNTNAQTLILNASGSVTVSIFIF